MQKTEVTTSANISPRSLRIPIPGFTPHHPYNCRFNPQRFRIIALISSMEMRVVSRYGISNRLNNASCHWISCWHCANEAYWLSGRRCWRMKCSCAGVSVKPNSLCLTASTALGSCCTVISSGVSG